MEKANLINTNPVVVIGLNSELVNLRWVKFKSGSWVFFRFSNRCKSWYWEYWSVRFNRFHRIVFCFMFAAINCMIAYYWSLAFFITHTFPKKALVMHISQRVIKFQLMHLRWSHLSSKYEWIEDRLNFTFFILLGFYSVHWFDIESTKRYSFGLCHFFLFTRVFLY